MEVGMRDPSEAAMHCGYCVRRPAEWPKGEPVETKAVKVANLTRDEIGTWSDLQRRHPEFENPVFRPESSALLNAKTTSKLPCYVWMISVSASGHFNGGLAMSPLPMVMPCDPTYKVMRISRALRRYEHSAGSSPL
jgi:hypothetical protein